MNAMNDPGAITAQNATITAVISLPRVHISCAPPRIVVDASRPTAESPISGVVLAIRNTTAAATLNASGRPIESTGLRAIVMRQRAHRALPPGGSRGIDC